ncbi:MAG: hypothetical protein HND51_12640 [Chloroflexi bacterium]|nr:hypothetical protein [Chloroflexota bacterium]
MSQAFNKLLRRLFIWIATVLLIGAPLGFLGAAYTEGGLALAQDPSSTPIPFLLFLPLLAFALLIIALLVFSVIPAFVELITEWNTHRKAAEETEIFP